MSRSSREPSSRSCAPSAMTPPLYDVHVSSTAHVDAPPAKKLTPVAPSGVHGRGWNRRHRPRARARALLARRQWSHHAPSHPLRSSFGARSCREPAAFRPAASAPRSSRASSRRATSMSPRDLRAVRERVVDAHLAAEVKYDFTAALATLRDPVTKSWLPPRCTTAPTRSANFPRIGDCISRFSNRQRTRSLCR